MFVIELAYQPRFFGLRSEFTTTIAQFCQFRAMAVWWEPTQAELADRNGESPFVLPEFLEESNFQHLYKAHLQTLTAMCSNSKATL